MVFYQHRAEVVKMFDDIKMPEYGYSERLKQQGFYPEQAMMSNYVPRFYRAGR
jgi:hypothetical protein